MTSKLKLDWCSHDAAKYAVEHWHYSKCMPKSKQAKIGVWESGRFIGAICYGYSTTPYLGTAFGLSQQDCVELTRVALNNHIAPVSQILAISLRLLRKEFTKLRLIISLADSMQGHLGTIYQANGWYYIGRSSSLKQYKYQGKWRNDTPLHRLLAANKEFASTLPKRKIPGKHKYLMPLDKAMRKQIEPLHKPYPKSVGSIDSCDASATHAEEGSANLTPTLQLA